MIYNISNETLSVSISDTGAEIVSVIHKGKERVWQNDNGAWAGHSPVLFPVCGRSAVIIDEKDYETPFHGFARNTTFKCVKNEIDELTFCLVSNKDTLAVYPFEFELIINYKLAYNSVIITNEIKNNSKKTMLFALGRHDSFNLDKPIENYKLCFPAQQELLSQKTDDYGRLINLYVDFGIDKEFVLPADYLSDGQTIIFKDIKCGNVELKSLDGKRVCSIDFGDITNLLIWRPDGEQMICLEPWSALPDESGQIIDFNKNDKYYRLKANERKTICFELKYY